MSVARGRMVRHCNESNFRGMDLNLDMMKVVYSNTLKELANDPNNPDPARETLELGRDYAHMCREDKKETVFDEIVLNNDLTAAMAGRAKVFSPAKSSPQRG